MRFNKKHFLSILSISILISCGKVSPKGKIENKEVNIEDFNTMDLKGKFRIFFVQGPKNFVTVETYDNVYDNLDIDVKDKTLSIKENRPTKGVDFYNITVYSKYNPQAISMADSVEMNISSAIVHIVPARLDEACSVLAAMSGVEIHARSPEGKVVVTIGG